MTNDEDFLSTDICPCCNRMLAHCALENKDQKKCSFTKGITEDFLPSSAFEHGCISNGQSGSLVELEGPPYCPTGVLAVLLHEATAAFSLL